MSKQANLVLQWTVTGDDASGGTSQIAIPINPSDAQYMVVDLVGGTNIISLPHAFTYVLILPQGTFPGETPSTNGKTWDAPHTVGGDIAAGSPSLVGVTSTNSINISSSGSEALRMYFF